MKKFTRWLDTNSVATYLWDDYNPLGKIYKGLEKRDQAASARNNFCKSRKRSGWDKMFFRIEHFSKAQKLLSYIEKRHKAASLKHQELQAPSGKHQAQNNKRQASSHKQQAP